MNLLKVKIAKMQHKLKLRYILLLFTMIFRAKLQYLSFLFVMIDNISYIYSIGILQ